MGNSGQCELYVVDLLLQPNPATRIHKQKFIFEFGLSFSGIPKQNAGPALYFRRGIKIFLTIHRTIQVPDTKICIESTNLTGSAASRNSGPHLPLQNNKNISKTSLICTNNRPT